MPSHTWLLSSNTWPLAWHQPFWTNPGLATLPKCHPAAPVETVRSRRPRRPGAGFGAPQGGSPNLQQSETASSAGKSFILKRCSSVGTISSHSKIGFPATLDGVQVIGIREAQASWRKKAGVHWKNTLQELSFVCQTCICHLSAIHSP